MRKKLGNWRRGRVEEGKVGRMGCGKMKPSSLFFIYFYGLLKINLH